MSARLHIGNLPYNVTEEELRELFGQAGTVVSLDLPKDRYTNRPRGFGFVEMENSAEAEEAIRKFDGYSLEGRSMRVEIAREREQRASGYDRPSGGRSGYGGGGAGGAGGGWRTRGRQQGGEGRRRAA